MSSIATEPLGRLRLGRVDLARLLRGPALKAIVGAHLIVAAIILARGYGWLQPFELLIYDALRVAWAGHEPSNRIFVVGATEDDIADFDWPLRDGLLADLLERLASRKSRVIGVDIYRGKPKPRGRRAALFAQSGFWYNAVAAAADMEAFDRHVALGALMNEVGLVEPARYDRLTVSGGQSR